MDAHPIEYGAVQPVETVGPLYPAAEAGRQLTMPEYWTPAYRESLLQTPQLTPEQWAALLAPRFEGESYTSKTEVFRDYLRSVQDKLEGSDAVKDLRQKAKSGEELTAHDFGAAYRAYEHALRQTLTAMKPSLDRPYRSELQDLIAHLDWSLKDDMAEDTILLQEHPDVEVRHDPLKIFRLLNPKSRRIDYMDAGQVAADIRRFGSRLDRHQLQDVFREPARRAKLDAALDSA